MNAALAGAQFTFGVDASPVAIQQAQDNAQLNGFSDRTRFKKADVDVVLAGMIEQKETYDFVICDPPALVKSGKKKFAGVRKMVAVHSGAMRVTARGGMLVASSCDHNVTQEGALHRTRRCVYLMCFLRAEFTEALAEAARKAGRTAQIVWRGFAGVDQYDLFSQNGFPRFSLFYCVYA